jgi:hypothetical protein
LAPIGVRKWLAGASSSSVLTVRRAFAARGPAPLSALRRDRRSAIVQDEIHRLPRHDPQVPGQRIGELIEALGYAGAKTILDHYLREVRPLFERCRTYQRTVYAPRLVGERRLSGGPSASPLGARGSLVRARCRGATPIPKSVVSQRHWTGQPIGLCPHWLRHSGTPDAA